jgi:hypothetical protein
MCSELSLQVSMSSEIGDKKDWRELRPRTYNTDGSDLLLITLTLMSRTLWGKGADVDECRRCDTTTFTRHQRQKGMGEGGKVD